MTVRRLGPEEMVGLVGAPPPDDTGCYATVADVEALNTARKVGQGNNPTEAQVETYLEMSEAEINAILVDKGYEVPVASAYEEAWEFLRTVNAKGAWYLMELASPNSPNIDRAEKAYEAAKEMLVQAHEILEAPKNIERSEPRAPYLTFQPSGEVYDPFAVTQGGRSGNETNPANPYFSRTQQF